MFLNCLVIFLGRFVKLARCKPGGGLFLSRSKLRTGSISSWSNGCYLLLKKPKDGFNLIPEKTKDGFNLIPEKPKDGFNLI